MKKLGDYPEWQAASKKLVELQLELTEVEAAHAAGLANLASEASKSDRLTEKARRLLGGGTDERPTLAEREAEVETMSERRRVIVRAIEIQRAEMAALQSELSRLICQAAKPEYQKIVKRLAAAVKELGQAAEQERLYREDLADGGVSFTSHLPPLPLRGGWSRPAEVYGPVAMFTKEAKVCGYI